MIKDNGMMPIHATIEEVAAQPSVIARVLRELEEQIEQLAQEMATRNVNHVLASGSGDSWFAAQAVRMAWEVYGGVQFEGMQAYEYAAYGHPSVTEQTVHFVISSSGRPTTTWDTLDRALASPALVVGVTDNSKEDNPFVAKPHRVLIPQGSKVGWPAQTTSATMAMFMRLAVAFGTATGHLAQEESAEIINQLNAIPQKMQTALDAGKAWAEAIAPSLSHSPRYHIVGSGPNFAVAQNGSALWSAGPQEMSMPLTSEEFHHAFRIAAVGKGDPCILIAPGASATESRMRDSNRVVRAWGALPLLIATESTADMIEAPYEGVVIPEVAEPLSPLLTLMPLHALSIALAAQKIESGYKRPPGVPH